MKKRALRLAFLGLFAFLSACSTPENNREVIEKQPTCTEDGYGYVYNLNTNYRTETIVIPAYGHKIVMRTIPPTCEEQGYDLYYCAHCGHEDHRYNYVDALGHDYHTYETSATCHHQGYVESFCSRCGKDEFEPHFTDKLEHHFVFSKHVEPTHCGERGYDIFVCDLCGDTKKDNYTEPLEHDFELDQHIAPTCDSGGYDVYRCTRCGTTENRNHVPHLDHDFLIETIAPTCTSQGYDLFTCKLCGHQEKDHFVDPLPHSYELEVIPPTCTESAIEKKVCSVCGHLGEERHVGEPLGHDNEEHVVVPATCTEPMIIKDVCKRCGYESSTRSKGEPLGHDLVPLPDIESTCSSHGHTHRYECSRCDYETHDELELLPHVYEESVIAPTCTEPGHTHHQCRFCSYGYDGEITEALGHDLIHHEGKNATCFDDGYEAYDSCSRCDYSTYKAIPSFAQEAHTPSALIETVPATRLHEGYSVYECAICHAHYRADITPILSPSRFLNPDDDLDAKKTIAKCNDDYAYYLLYAGSIVDLPIHTDYAFQFTSSTLSLGSYPSSAVAYSAFEAKTQYEDRVNAAFAEIGNKAFDPTRLYQQGLYGFSSDTTPLRMKNGELDEVTTELLEKGNINKTPVEMDDGVFDRSPAISATRLAEANVLYQTDVNNSFQGFEEGYYYFYSYTVTASLYLSVRYDLVHHTIDYAPYSILDGGEEVTFRRDEGGLGGVYGNFDPDRTDFDFVAPDYETNHPRVVGNLTTYDNVPIKPTVGENVGVTIMGNFDEYYAEGYDRIQFYIEFTWENSNGIALGLNYRLDNNLWYYGGNWKQFTSTGTRSDTISFDTALITKSCEFSFFFSNEAKSAWWWNWVKVTSVKYRFTYYNSRAKY